VRNRVVILGSSGLIGQACLKHFEGLNTTVIAPDRKEFEVRGKQLLISSTLVKEMQMCPVIDLLHSNEWHLNEEIQVNSNYLVELAEKIGSTKKSTPYIYFSSGAVYGPSPTIINEENPVNLSNSYAKYKYMMENECRTRFEHHKVFRLFFPYGQSQRPERLIPRLLSMIESGTPIMCNQNGGPSLSIIHANDVAEVLYEELKLPWCGTRNLAGGEIIKIRDLAVFLGQLVGIAPKFEVNLVNAESYVASSHDGREWRQIRNEEKFSSVIA
jgi:nucleoside-diphosphate-sugar epimerase